MTALPMADPSLEGTNRVGSLLRHWRLHRRLSQLDLSNRAGVSTRHLSFVETGRAQPSRELLLHLARDGDPDAGLQPPAARRRLCARVR